MNAWEIMSIAPTMTTLAAFLALQATFVWGRFAVFRIDGETPAGVRLIEGSATFGILIGAVLIASRDGASVWWDVPSFAVAAMSGALYAWAVRTVRQRRLTASFSKDTPLELIDRGPFRLVRHPFYLAYLLCYLQALLASRSTWALLPLAWMGIVYATAARREEQKFMSSPLAPAYAAYKQTTGAFVPHLATGRTSRS